MNRTRKFNSKHMRATTIEPHTNILRLLRMQMLPQNSNNLLCLLLVTPRILKLGDELILAFLFNS